MEGLNKVVKNKIAIPKDKPCLQVLGSNAAVNACAKFFENNAETLTILAAAKLLKYSEEEVYDSKEFLAYKKAIGEMTSFFVECWKEIDAGKKDVA